MMFAEILSLNQKFEFGTGSMGYVLSLRLPNGRIINVNVDDETSQQLVEARLNPDAVPAAPTTPAERMEIASPPVSPTYVELEGGGQAAVFGEEPTEESAPPAPAQPQRAVHVDKDEWGYPIRREPGAVDVETVTGGVDRDEDGVGSI